MTKPKKSVNRFRARELEQKIMPAIKMLSKYVFTTAPDAPKKNFFGYKVPAGEFTDEHGNKFQVQIHAYRTKSDFIKKDEIKPIIRKWAIFFRLRLFAKMLIDKLED